MAKYFLMLKTKANSNINGFVRFTQAHNKLEISIKLEGDYNLYKASMISEDRYIYLGDLTSKGDGWRLEKSLGIAVDKDDVNVAIMDNSGLIAVTSPLSWERAEKILTAKTAPPPPPPEQRDLPPPPPEKLQSVEPEQHDYFPTPALPGYVWQWERWSKDFKPGDRLSEYVLNMPAVASAIRRHGYFLHSENGTKKALAIPSAFAFEPHPLIDLYDCAYYLDGYWVLGIESKEKYFFALDA